MSPSRAAAAIRTPARRPRTTRRRKPDPIRTWVRRLDRTRPGLVRDTLDLLAGLHGHPVWQRRFDPTSELILTILTQNSADVNAEKAFEALRLRYPSDLPSEAHLPGGGWGGIGLSEAPPPDWAAVAGAPLDELVDVIRPGGLAPQKAPRIQATLRRVHAERGVYSLEFLGTMAPLDARDWLTSIDGIGRKTASVLQLFSFGHPLMPVDRHVERVSKRIGLIPPKASADDAHELFLALLSPADIHEAHVNLIRHGRLVCHALRPACDGCPVRPRCRHVDPKAP